MVRNKYEQELMRKSGKISALVLKEVLKKIRVGVSCIELDESAERMVKKLGGEASFKTVPGYKWTTCITINEQVVHGIPTERKIKEGDLVSVDLGTVFKGWHTDCAWTVLVGRDDKKDFLKVGEKALWDGVTQAIDGNRVGDISVAIQENVEGLGYHVVRSLVGHGIGKSLHEDPEVPGYGTKGQGPILKKGETLAIEVIYGQGTSEVVLEEDGWTVSTLDGSLAGLFEMTVIIGKDRAEVLTDWRKV